MRPQRYRFPGDFTVELLVVATSERQAARSLASDPQTVLVTSLEEFDGWPGRIIVADNPAADGAAIGESDSVVTAGMARSARQLRDYLELLLLGRYRVRPEGPHSLQVVVARKQRAAAATAIETAWAVWWARWLANSPSNTKTPQWLADQVTTMAAEAGIHYRIFGQSDLHRMGAGGLLAVGAGSQHEPLLVQLEYRPPKASRHVGLVGKGITFDSGGLSIKPADSMKLMKTDMAGSAAVAAATISAARQGLPVRLTALLAIAENLPSGSAMRPGDVVVHLDGRTGEVRNTDAEGRLVLADALAYAATEIKPDVLVDVATLTGAATMALSRFVGSLFTPDERLAKALLKAGKRSGDSLWRMPLVPEYQAAIASEVADQANTSTDAHNRAGAITAAWYLRPFAAEIPWAHLDIAGPARAEKDRPGFPTGATGYGTRLLLSWLTSLAGGK